MFRGWRKYAGLFFLSAWMFTSGLLVGRGTSPVEFDTAWFQKRLAVIFDRTTKEERPQEKPELEFYEALRQEQEEKLDFIVGRDDLGLDSMGSDGGTVERGGKTPDDPEGPVPLKQSRKTMTLSLRSGSVFPETKEKVDTPSTEPGSDSQEKSSRKATVKSKQSVEKPDENKDIYTIQIASYQNSSDADHHVSQLKAKGYHAYKIAATLEGDAWYRVRIGKFKSMTDAQKQLKAFQKKGINGLILKNH